MRNARPQMTFGGEGPARRAVVLVRNDASTDARIHRQAQLLGEIGYQVTVLAVRRWTGQAPLERVNGGVIRRLPPMVLPAVLRGVMAGTRRGFGSRGAGRPRSTTPAAVAGSATTGPTSVGVRVSQAMATAHYAIGVARHLRRLRPVLVHANDYNTMAAGLIARLLGARVVYDSHELWADRNGRREVRWLLIVFEWLWVRMVQAIIATSPGHADVLASRYRIERPRLVRNVAPAESRVGKRPAMDYDSVAVYVGRITTQRGLEEAIAALPEVPDLHVVLVGPSAEGYAEQLAALALRYGVADRVKFRPAVPPEGVVDALVALRPAFGLSLIRPDCLSYRLSLPNKLNEYALAGVPVLVSDLPVMADWLRAANIGAVAGGDTPREIGRTMSAMLDPARQAVWRRNAQALVDSRPWLAERDALKKVYEDVMAASAEN